MKEALIDTDILSYYLKGNQDVIEKVVEYLKTYPTLNISTITYFEVLGGLEYKKASRQIKDFKELVSNCNVHNIDKESIAISAKEYGRLRRKGITIGSPDLLIAGIALKNNLTLITNNENHFKPMKLFKKSPQKRGDIKCCKSSKLLVTTTNTLKPLQHVCKII